MNIHKHMEAIFVVALAVVGFGTMALDSSTEANASAPVVREVAAAPAAGAAALMCASKTSRRA
jgi:hypothetical protein